VAIARIVFVYKNRKLFDAVSMEDIPVAPAEDIVSAN
jgi:hypothetical protein